MHLRRAGWLVPLLLANLTLGMGGTVSAQEAENAKKAEVPLQRVVLFTSGVGFFERSSEIQGNAEVELQFNVDDVNDLLKSMVVQDLAGGKISTVTYGSRDPITKTLETFSIDLTSSPSMGDLLRQIRGEAVEVTAVNQIEGTIVGVETRRRKIDDELIEKDYLNLLTDEGLRSLALDEITRIKILDAKLAADFRKALEVLAMGHDNEKKSVTLKFTGEGKRPVRIGYIQESPVWKTSYRLVLDDDQPPFLQGWAVVENTSEEDWDNVQLALVSGRPISFIMDLYTPLYVDRPVVEQELYASLRPQMYDQDLADEAAEFRAKKAERENADRRRAMPNAPPAPTGAALARDALSKEKAAQGYFALKDMKQSAVSLAQAEDVGELFQYSIDQPVSLARHRSAMLPIVNENVEGRKVSIYNPSVHPKHPLAGLELTNATKLHLMQGPITVFDGGAYAGDARIPDLPPGSMRLVSYAMDLDTEVAETNRQAPEQITKVWVNKGVLYAERKYERTTEYVVKNSGDRVKTVLIEKPIDSSWKLLQPKEPADKTRDLYRFAVEAMPGEPAKLVVEEEQVITQQFVLSSLDINSILFYLNRRIVSEELKTKLEEVIAKKQAIDEVLQDRRRLEQEIAVIGKEQERIRANMQQLERTTDLYNRYVKKFTEQEDRIEALRKQIADLQEKEVELRKELEEYLSKLTVT